MLYKFRESMHNMIDNTVLLVCLQEKISQMNVHNFIDEMVRTYSVLATLLNLALPTNYVTLGVLGTAPPTLHVRVLIPHKFLRTHAMMSNPQ